MQHSGLITAFLYSLLFVGCTTQSQPQVTPAATSKAASEAATITENTDWQPVEQDFDGARMVQVPAGTFEMGSEASFIDAFGDTTPHLQRISQAFWIDKFEVTNADFAVYLNAEDSPYADSESVSYAQIEWTGERWQAQSGLESHPALNVTWFGTRDYCAWRGTRLPTELEWEYAAKGPSNWDYPWGEAWNPDFAIWGQNHPQESRTAPVGSIPASASWVGAMDMSGNVWEWTSTIFGSDIVSDSLSEFAYPYDAADGREDLQRADMLRVVRGGSWVDEDAINLHTAFRFGGTPDDRFYVSGGFRCARS